MAHPTTPQTTDQHDSDTAQDSDVEVVSTHHIVPLFVYFRVFTALMVLLVLTLFVAAFNLPGPLNIIVAMTVAVIKAVLIILYFMHVRYSSRTVWVFSGAAFFWLMILFSLTFSDYGTRNFMTLGK